MTRFDRDTAIEDLGGGVYGGAIDPGWWILAGPNGGYCSAILFRAMTAAAGVPDRPPRALHVYFLSAPKEGELRVETRVLRRGRSLTVVGADMKQGDKTVLTGSLLLSKGFSEIAFQDATMPAALPVEQAEPLPKRIPINDRYDMRRAIGGPMRQSERAVTGGWIRLEEPRTVDAQLLSAIWDPWPPATHARRIDSEFNGVVPTVEATVYFRKPTPLPTSQPDDYLLLQVESLMAEEGIVEETGEVWSPDGVLLVQSRQLALMR